MSVTNRTAVTQRVPAKNGQIIEIEPFDTRDVTIREDDPRVQAKIRAGNITIQNTKKTPPDSLPADD